MKFDWERKNTVNVITGVLIFVISILFYFIFLNIKTIFGYTSNIRYILMPFIVGGAIAYILNFFVRFFEKLILKVDFFKKLKPNYIRATAMIITYIIAFVFMFFSLKYIIPKFYSNIKSFVEQTPEFVEKTIEELRYRLQDIELSPEIRRVVNNKLTEFATSTTTFLTSLIPYVATFATKVISTFLNMILSVIISAYILYDKETNYIPLIQ